MLRFQHTGLQVLQEGPAFTTVYPSFQTNPLRQYTPTWEKFDFLGYTTNFQWDAGADWLEDYSYYAEVISDAVDDWWGTGMSTPSDGDADIPQPKVYRSFSETSGTILDFERFASRHPDLPLHMTAEPCDRLLSASRLFSCHPDPPLHRMSYNKGI